MRQRRRALFATSVAAATPLLLAFALTCGCGAPRDETSSSPNPSTAGTPTTDDSDRPTTPAGEEPPGSEGTPPADLPEAAPPRPRSAAPEESLTPGAPAPAEPSPPSEVGPTEPTPRGPAATEEAALPRAAAPEEAESESAAPTGATIEGREVVVYYGTNRKPTSGAPQAGHLDGFYGSDRDRETLHYGTCRVSVPTGHVAGKIERPWSVGPIKLPEDPASHFVIRALTPMERAPFLGELREAIRRSKSGQKEAFVFIHGYNVPFGDAAYRTAQIAWDLQFDGPAILFSWPTRGVTEAYLEDQEIAELSRGALKTFLRDVAEDSGAERVHLIAHSMGNRVLTYALAELAQEPAPEGRPGPRFDQVILTAPDIDAEVFREVIAPHFARSARHVTLYASANDYALAASRNLRRGRVRLGEDIRLVADLPGIDGVDASTVETGYFSLGHSYFADTPALIRDIGRVLAGDAPGSRGLHRVAPPGYWTFNPNARPGASPWVAAGGIALGATAAFLLVLARRMRRARAKPTSNPG